MTSIETLLTGIVNIYIYEYDLETVYEDLLTYNIYGFRDFVDEWYDKRGSPGEVAKVIDEWSNQFRNREWAKVGEDLLKKSVPSFCGFMKHEIEGQFSLIASRP